MVTHTKEQHCKKERKDIFPLHYQKLAINNALSQYEKLTGEHVGEYGSTHKQRKSPQGKIQWLLFSKFWVLLRCPKLGTQNWSTQNEWLLLKILANAFINSEPNPEILTVCLFRWNSLEFNGNFAGVKNEEMNLKDDHLTCHCEPTP